MNKKTVKMANVLIKFSDDRNATFDVVIRDGIVVAESDTHVKVWNHRDKETSAKPENAEWFAIESKRCRTEVFHANLD
jgi:hypothetical protein